MPGLGIDFSSATSEADSHDLWEGVSCLSDLPALVHSLAVSSA